jgi:hypothetical protein
VWIKTWPKVGESVLVGFAALLPGEAWEPVIQPRALIPPLGAADPCVLVDRHNLPSAVLGGTFQFAALILSRLLVSADTKIERRSFCFCHGHLSLIARC